MAKAATKQKAPAKKPAPAKPLDTLQGTVLSTQGMAVTLGVTTRWLQILVKDGTIPSIGRGRFDPTEVFQAYALFLKEGAQKKTGNDSLDELRQEKAADIRINRLRKDRELIALTEATSVIEDIAGIFVSYLSGLPAQITGVPRERQRLNEIIDTGRQRLADRFTERVQALREGRQDLDPAAEDDAA